MSAAVPRRPRSAVRLRPYSQRVSVWDALTTRQIARILFTTAAFLALMYLLVQIRSTLLLLGIAIFLAVALGPAVDLFSRGRLPRSAAILVVYLLLAGVLGGVLALVVPPVINGATDLSRDIPSYIDDLRNNKTIREFDNKYDITSKLQEEARKLPAKLGDAAGALQSVATGVFNAAFQLLTILTMTFFLLLDGKRIANFLITRFGRHREERLRGIAERIYKSTSGYVGGALTITSINGILTFIVLTILGVPFAVPLAVLMSFFGLIPLVGATIGGVIILLVTLFTDFPSATIIYGIFLIFYQQFENNVLQPFIFKRTVNVPPLAVIVAILAGSSILGVVGALVAIPIAAALQIVIKEYYSGETLVSGTVILPDEVPPPDAPPPPDEPPPPPPPVTPPRSPKPPKPTPSKPTAVQAEAQAAGPLQPPGASLTGLTGARQPSADGGRPPTPIIPGPAWAPITGPTSLTKRGSQPKTSSPRSTSRCASPGAWMCCTHQASAPSACSVRMYSTMRSNARPRVRTRSTGVISDSSERIGLIFRAPPSQAWAPPIRPPRRRYSSVSTANQIRRLSRAAWACAATSCSAPPACACAAAASSSRPRPPQTVRESSTSTRPSKPRSASCARACSAESYVPDSAAEMWIETMS